MVDSRKSAWSIIIAGIVMAIVFFVLNGLFASLRPRLPRILYRNHHGKRDWLLGLYPLGDRQGPAASLELKGTRAV